jgi:D-alanine--poly(phosphoribitol) ligase subunit 2
MTELQQEIYAIIAEMRPDNTIAIQPGDDLFALGILDSFGMLSFIVKLEEKFALSIANQDLIPQNFWSVEATAETIRRLKHD